MQKNYIIYTPEEIQFIKDNYLQMNYLEIAIRLNRKPESIQGKIERMNLKKRHRPDILSKKEIIIDQYLNEGVTLKDLARKYSSSYLFLRNLLKSWDVELRKDWYLRSEKHHSWKGDNVSLKPLHIWIRRRKPKPEFCEECKKVPPKDLANISGEYHRDINDFRWLCRKCHMTSDDRIKNLDIRHQFKKIIDGKLKCSRCKKDKLLKEFYLSHNQNIGYSPSCKECQSIKTGYKTHRSIWDITFCKYCGLEVPHVSGRSHRNFCNSKHYKNWKRGKIWPGKICLN